MRSRLWPMCAIIGTLLAGAAVPVRAAEPWGLTDGRTTIIVDTQAIERLGLRVTSIPGFGSADRIDLSGVTIPFNAHLAARIVVSDGVLATLDGAVRHDGGIALVGPTGELTLNPLMLRMSETPGEFYIPAGTTDLQPALILRDTSTVMDMDSRTLLVSFDRISLSKEWAATLGVEPQENMSIGSAIFEVRLARLDQIVAGAVAAVDCPGAADVPVIGPDVIVGSLSAVTSYGSLNGISAFAVGTDSCNIGDECLQWIASTNQHPVIAQNMYRLKNDRFEQIGQSWLKHGFTALTGNLCGLGCTPPGTGTLLGVGCSDPYSSSLNGTQSILGPRTQVDANSGVFTYPRDLANPSCLGCSKIDRRLQVHNEDLNNPGALYFVEGLYIAGDDAQHRNGNNNASYRPIFFGELRCKMSVSPFSFTDILCSTVDDCPPAHSCSWFPSSCPASLTADDFCAITSGTTQREQPAIRAWRDNDVGVVETDVQIPEEGLLLLAAKAVSLGNGQWRYEYALENLNSDRSAGSFSIPLPLGVVVEGVGFHDVDAHSGEPYGTIRCMTCQSNPSIVCQSDLDCPDAGDTCAADDNACVGAVCSAACSSGARAGQACISTVDCRTCTGGPNHGDPCIGSADCSGSACLGTCNGYCEKPPCTDDTDCFGAVCDVGTGICGNDWPAEIEPGSITWSTTSFETDPFANAIRWGTMYNFWFEANVGPETSTATIGLFKTGFPDQVQEDTVGPALGLVDCNGNGISDLCDLDCNAVGCEIPCGKSVDCNGNSVPDECEPDCNNNGVADECDIAVADGGVCIGPDCSSDCQPNTVPDDCEPDCDGDGLPDSCEGVEDCDGDGIEDCDDDCPCTTPAGSCTCESDGCCEFPTFPNTCFQGFTETQCLEAFGTWICDHLACRSGCLLGDWDRDGDIDIKDEAEFQNCFSGQIGEPGFEPPSQLCLDIFDYEGDGDVDHDDFKEFEPSITGPNPVFHACPGTCTECATDEECDDENACTVDTCFGSACLHDPSSGCVPCEGTGACDDGDGCTTTDTCTDGVCLGTPIPECQPCTDPSECNDGNACTDDDCVASECVNIPNFDEATACCDPVSGGTAPVDDGDPCTQDICDPLTGQVSHDTPAIDGTSCDDGVFCNGDDSCVSGICSMHDGDPCVGGSDCSNTCDEANDSCNTPSSTPCSDDGNVCTDNLCDGLGACAAVSNAVPCDDGLFCNGGDACSGGSCSVHNGDPCIAGPECQNACNEFDDTCNVANNTACTSDGNVCTNNVCDGLGICVTIGNLSPCDDGLFCNGADTCSGGSCTVHDGDPCAGGPVCATTCDDANDVCHTAAGTSCTDDGDVCTDNVCDGLGQCTAVNNTAPCDDGDECTVDDVCNAEGACVGSPSNEPACLGFAELCVRPRQGSFLVDGCYAQGEDIYVDVVLTESPVPITGGQFTVDFDPTKLTAIDVEPGTARDPSSPFSVEILESIDNVGGSVFYVVGTPAGHPGTVGPDLMATIQFRPLIVCGDLGTTCFTENPLPNSALTDSTGQKVPFTICCDADLTIPGDAPEITCPPDVSRNADPGTFKGLVTWVPPEITGGCDGAAALVCTATHSTGINIDGLIETGGLFPVGTAEFECSTVDGCGTSAGCTWTVQINPANLFNVTVQLSPTIVAGPLHRCIEFEFFSNCVEPPNVIEQVLQFGLPFSLPGQATNLSFKVPSGKYICVTARDPLHTLRAVSDIVVVDNLKFSANFVGDPFFGGNWLVGGNLNGDRVIDILDFGIFVLQELTMLPSDTTCGLEGPHADINGDGIVDPLDLFFISTNFFEADKDSCCPGVAGAVQTPIFELSLSEADELGLPDLRRADLNQDGLVNYEDVLTALRRGITPNPKSSRESTRR